MACLGTLRIATVTVLVILAAVQPGEQYANPFAIAIIIAG